MAPLPEEAIELMLDANDRLASTAATQQAPSRASRRASGPSPRWRDVPSRTQRPVMGTLRYVSSERAGEEGALARWLARRGSAGAVRSPAPRA